MRAVSGTLALETIVSRGGSLGRDSTISRGGTPAAILGLLAVNGHQGVVPGVELFTLTLLMLCQV